jgi:hypothetical protein
MAQETLKITITADNKQALEGLQQTSVATTQLSSNLGKLPSASNQANQALLNSGRVLQDLNYGFIGVANNLNPLLESFQRLGERSKEAGSSIGKELVSALTGPAGIGVALSAATFLFLKFGDEISNFITQKVSGLNVALGTEIKVFDDASKAYVKASTDINNLNQAHEQYKNGLITKDAFLKQFNNTLDDTIAKTNSLSTAEKFLTENSEAYVKMVFYKAVAQEAAAQAAKKQVEQLSLEELAPTPTLGERALAFISPAGTSGEDIAERNRKNKIKELEYDTYVLQEINKKYNIIANNIQESFTRIFGPATVTTPKEKKIKSPVKLISDGVYDASLEEEARKQLSKTPFVSKIPQAANIGNGSLFGMFDETTNGKIRTTKNELTDFFKQTKEGFAQANNEAYQFASEMSGGVTNSLQSAFDALIAGENVFEALSKSVLQFAEDLAFAIIRAEILAAIQGAIATSGTGLAGAAAGGGGILNTLMNLLGLGITKNAVGGITNGPSLGLIGEAGPEAIMPLSKLSSFLNTSFNAGAMSSTVTGTGGQFVLRGQDLLLAVNRSQKASNIKGQSISLA